MDVESAPPAPSRSRSPTPSANGETAKARSKSPEKRRDDAPAQEDKPAKRVRTVAREDQARGKRMFGNILGTLRKFQDEDKNSKKSDAAKRREETSARIAAQLRSEANAHADLANAERELKALRLQTENTAFVLEHREIAMTACHRTLRSASRYLSTTSTPGTREGALYPSSPAPTVQARGSAMTSLYFLPKVLLPHQEEKLAAREREIRATIDDEEDALERDKAEARTQARENAEKVVELEEKVRRLREAKSAGGERTGRGVRERSEPRLERERESRESMRADSVSERPREVRKRSETPDGQPPRQRADDEMEVEY